MSSDASERSFHFPLAGFATIAAEAGREELWEHGPAYVNLLTKPSSTPGGPSWTSLDFLPNPLAQAPQQGGGPAALAHGMHVVFGECHGNILAAWLDGEVEVRMALGEGEGGWMGVRLRFAEGVMEMLRFVGRLPKDWDVKQATTSLDSFMWDGRAGATRAAPADDSGGAVQAAWPSVEDESAQLNLKQQAEGGLHGLSEAELHKVLLKTLCAEGMDAVVRQVKRALDAE